METKLSFRELTDKMMGLYNEGRYADAFQIVEQNADRFPDQVARITLWKMCMLSLCGRVDEVISVFQQGLDSGLWWAESQFRDTDLDAVRDLPEFKRLISISLEKYEQARRHMQPDRAILLPDERQARLPLLIALHGGGGNKESNLEYWKVACQHGWLVLSPQSTQPFYLNAYCWDDPEQGVQDILFHLKEVLRTFPVDVERMVIAGISQGSGMAIYAALSGKIPVRGFMCVATWWFDVKSLAVQAALQKGMRGYFVTGEKDHTLERAREIQDMLRANVIQVGEEVYPDLGHDFPPDFETSFDKAIDFIFKEAG